jgi:sugar fermentation stimulation protein A
MEFEGRRRWGTFLERPNRFTAVVDFDGRREQCFLPNPGRLKELLLPGARVLLLEREGSRNRKTRYDLTLVLYRGEPISVDARLPNRLVREALEGGRLIPFHGYSRIQAEAPWGQSRVDFLLEGRGGSCLLEVKSCTLVRDGRALFPDAVTERGRRHCRELVGALQRGYRAAVLFVIQRSDASLFSPNDAADPAFGKALRHAAALGVEVFAFRCRVTERGISLGEAVEVDLTGGAHK